MFFIFCMICWNLSSESFPPYVTSCNATVRVTNLCANSSVIRRVRYALIRIGDIGVPGSVQGITGTCTLGGCCSPPNSSVIQLNNFYAENAAKTLVLVRPEKWQTVGDTWQTMDNWVNLAGKVDERKVWGGQIDILVTMPCDTTPCSSRAPISDSCSSTFDQIPCYIYLNSTCGTDCSTYLYEGSGGRCVLKQCASRSAVWDQPVCGPNCFQQVVNGGTGTGEKSGEYGVKCNTSCDSRHFTANANTGKCERKVCEDRKNISDLMYPCASEDCYQQIDAREDVLQETCSRTCPEGSKPSQGKCVILDKSCQTAQGNATYYCASRKCNQSPTRGNCCPDGNVNMYDDVCERYCAPRTELDECSCANVRTYPRCCGNCTPENGYEGCDLRTTDCDGFCIDRKYVNKDCARYVCRTTITEANCCGNFSVPEDCDFYCEDKQHLPVCALRTCSKYEAWFQRDKCICERIPDSEACEVHCKPPFFNYIKCAKIFENNDELLCIDLGLTSSCERYCGSNQSCLCERVSRDYCQNSVCVPGNEDECECKYGTLNDRDAYCRNYCERFLNTGAHDDYYRCRCEYLNEVTSCSQVCDRKETPFLKLECQCTTSGLLDDDAKTLACTDMCSRIPEDDEEHTLTKDLCKCRYLEDGDACGRYCGSYSYEDSTQRQPKMNCECLYLEDVDACVEECGEDHTLNAVEKQLCVCEEGRMASDCMNYCLNKFEGSASDPKNSRIRNCMCVVAGQAAMCSEYCKESTLIDNEDQRKVAEFYCVRMCNAQAELVPGEDPDDAAALARAERRKKECFCENLTRDGDCIYGCEWIMEGYADANDYVLCGRYCNSLIWPDKIAACLCDYGINIQLCRSFCVGSDFSASRCNEFCKNQSSASDILLCRCYFDLDVTACVAHCNEETVESVRLKCLCDLGIKEECARSCEAFGEEGKAMEKARCLCRHQIDKNACFEYCDLAFAGFDDSHVLQERCKCDYGLGEGYCSRYIATFETKERLLYECQQRNNTQACYDYCFDHVAVELNLKETSKCWCEIYGDVVYCPVYCNSLNVSDAELLRCKCLHFSDNPSCIQYCATIPRGPAHDECECTLVTPEEDTGPTSSHTQACMEYCRAKPSYMERMRCACDTGLDANRCSEEAQMQVKELQSAKYKERCELSWNGTQHEYDCRNYCNLLEVEASDEGRSTGREELLQCYCDVVKLNKGVCHDFCQMKHNSDSSADYHECMCEHAKRRKSCDVMCPLRFPGDTGTSTQIYECNCRASRFWKDGLLSCPAYCSETYGGEGLIYHSCYSGFDRCAYKPYCAQFADVSMQEFCLCFHEPDSVHCTSYCTQLAVEVTTGELPIVDMCRCVWEENNTACRVFCDADNYADYLCYRSCDTFETTLEYQKCLCTAGASDRACASVCDEYIAANDMDSYYECRCTHSLDLLSCVHYCNGLSTAVEQAACTDLRVNLGPGNITTKGLYVDNYDFEDSYTPSVITSDAGTSNVTDNDTSNTTDNSTSNDTEKKLTKAERTRQNNEKNAAIVFYTFIGTVAVCVAVIAVLMIIVFALLYRRNSRRRKEAEKEAVVWRKSFQRMSRSISKQRSTEGNSADGASANSLIFGSRPTPSSRPASEVDEATNLIMSLAANPTCSLDMFRWEYEAAMRSAPTVDQCAAFMKEKQRLAQ